VKGTVQMTRIELLNKLFRKGVRFVWRELRDPVFLNRYLKNGSTVWIRSKLRQPLPPLEFRNGLTWLHGQRDEPIALFREIYVERLYRQIEPSDGAHVIDVGANIGAVMLFWAKNTMNLNFHAYEPNPEAYRVLCENIVKNNLSSQASTYLEAIGGDHGQMNLWINVPSLLVTAYGDAPTKGARKVAVPMITLDDAWERIQKSPIWMLKIDTEGAEGDILEATTDAMLNSVQTACIECHDNIVPGVFDRCKSRLERAGFNLDVHKHPWGESIIYATRARAGG
jgi:FkbM family methyltransferase